MKRSIITLFLLSVASPLFAATVGGPDISVPERSLFLKEQAVNRALDHYEINKNVKTGFDVEITTKRKLSSISGDTSNAELKGQAYMVKISNNFQDIFEPYIKIGSCNFEVKWDQYGDNVKVEAKPGFAYSIGAKLKVHEFEGSGIKLTLDGQFRDIDLDIDKAKLGGSTSAAAATSEVFNIKEWQASLLASKKFIFNLGENDYYAVPYGGITYSNTEVDVHFTRSTNGILYSTFDAGSSNEFGVVMGFDIMPFYLSYYLLNFELRLMNETALSVGGTIKF